MDGASDREAFHVRLFASPSFTEKLTKRVSLLTCKICKQNTPRRRVCHIEVDRCESTEMDEIADTQPDPHAVLFCRRHLCFLMQSSGCTTAHSIAPPHPALTGSSAASSPSGTLPLMAEQQSDSKERQIFGDLTRFATERS